MPNPLDDDSSQKDKVMSFSSTKSQKIPPEAMSKVSGVNIIETLINQVIDFNLDPVVSDDLIACLQELSKIYINKPRDIKASVRDLLNDKVISPLIKLIQDRETYHLSNIYDIKSRLVDVDARQYQAKIRESESTIEYLRGKLNIVNTQLDDFKKDLKDSSKNLIDTTKEVRSLISKASPSFSDILQSRPIVPTKGPMNAQLNNHVVLLRPKKDSSSEDNRKLVENALITRNSPARINRISKVSKGGLIIEAPTKEDLEALEAEIKCVSTLGEQFEISKPRRRRPQIIILGLPNDVDKERLIKGLSSKNHYLCDVNNKPLFEVNFSIRARFNTNWVVSVDPSVYKRLFEFQGLYFEFTRLRFDNFFGIKQCRHCRKFGHTTKWCPRAQDVLCGNCGLEHPTESCKEVICVNCRDANQRSGTTFKINHKPNDRSKCESYEKQKANLVRLTDYGLPSGSPS
ncbi:hypothetical protein AVEN_207701-1 [Araneus ventricosus]|uniref:CCHC-type domain-containing protein n=1 Tax=Araneus ventricosus TaxID=182803 RepID=A0A4Y2PDI5_ARAVE|nr:hypothetical protein AVEN_207701-1 [Araneus ventricosus]